MWAQNFSFSGPVTTEKPPYFRMQISSEKRSSDEVIKKNDGTAPGYLPVSYAGAYLASLLWNFFVRSIIKPMDQMYDCYTL